MSKEKSYLTEVAENKGSMEVLRTDSIISGDTESCLKRIVAKRKYLETAFDQKIEVESSQHRATQID